MVTSKKGPSRAVNFQLSSEELRSIASGKSVEIPSAVFFGKTAFTIENAPIPKSTHDKVTIKLDVTRKA